MMTMNLGPMYGYGESTTAYYADEHSGYYGGEDEYSPRNHGYSGYTDGSFHEGSGFPPQEDHRQKQEGGFFTQDVNIINGLSYTNLDYQYGSGTGLERQRLQDFEHCYPCQEESYPGAGQDLHQYQHVKEEQHYDQQQHSQHRLQPPQAPTVPTYKWMQVKRNVPKPTGEYRLQTIYYYPYYYTR